MTSNSKTPRFSIVVAMPEGEGALGRLGDTISSISDCELTAGEVEVVVATYGLSTPTSGAAPPSVGDPGLLIRMLTGSNEDRGSAWNAGIAQARGAWIGFAVAGDRLAGPSLSRVSALIDTEPDLVAATLRRTVELAEIDKIQDRHPLRGMFDRTDRVRDASGDPRFFLDACRGTFVRAELVQANRLSFNASLESGFSEGDFCARLLLLADRPLIGFVGSSRIVLHQAAGKVIATDHDFSDPRTFSDVPRVGYLALLHSAPPAGSEAETRPPEWLQNLVISELISYLAAEDGDWSAATACRGPLAEQFLVLLSAIRSQLDPAVISSFNARPLRADWRQLLLFAFAGPDWHSPYAVSHRFDRSHQEVLLSYRFVGPEPQWQQMLRGRPVTQVATKIRVFRLFDRVLMRERLIWTKADGTVRFTLEGLPVEIRSGWSEFAATTIQVNSLRRRLGVPARPTGTTPIPAAKPALSRLRARLPRIPRRARILGLPARLGSRRDKFIDTTILKLAASQPVRQRFQHAWVVMDRVNDCGDSGERLFRYLRRRQRQRSINAWFVIDKNSSDYRRLKADGYRRVVGYGTVLWKLLMLNCDQLISSHIDVPIVRPPLLGKLIRNTSWKFTFLQHGVIKDDLSGWLNGRKIDLFVTSTPAEHESIVGDNSRYVFTDKEVKMVGLPRFDRLQKLASQLEPTDQRLILVAPTWRDWLSDLLVPGEFQRRVSADFPTSDYARNWLGFLRSPELADLCRRNGLRIGFLPHPNMQPILRGLDLPPHVEGLTYDDNDVQDLFARTRVMVTDYSSVAFNSAYIERPVVSFQFDRQRVEAGEHRGRQGYFDYERDGFGPVALSLAEAVSATTAAVDHGPRTAEPYASRIEAAFPRRDGKCCARVTAAIRAI